MEDGMAVVLFSGQAPVKGGDEYYPFSPDRNFYYVTGIAEQKLVLLLGKVNGIEEAVLFIERDNGAMAKWVGATMTVEEARRASMIDHIAYLDEFENELASFLFKNNIHTVGLDLENRDWNAALSLPVAFAEKVRRRYPAVQIKDMYPVFAELRMIKEEYELGLMRKAIAITCEGVREMMARVKENMYEYELEAYFDFVLKKNGVKQHAFASIVAAGKNSTILHYVQNDGKMQKGDLVLVDVGAQAGWYHGDISRTFPVSGKFSEKQKLIYNIVLEGQRRVIEAIAPGIRFSSLNQLLRDYYYEELKKIGLVEVPEDVDKYYYHGVSHYLGAQTHDIGRYGDRNLCPGMVLTVEPGLYIEEWNIGIRIEDDILVTADGRQVLSQGMIKTVEEIEAFMSASHKMQQD